MEILIEVWNWLNGTGLVGALAIATQVIGAFAVLATITPTDSDDKIVALLQKVIHFLGANFGKAKNAG